MTVWQRVVVFGFAMILWVVVMQTWVWDSLNHSMIEIDQDIATLTQKKKESLNSMALLQNVEQEVESLREKFSSRYAQLSRSSESKTFRKDIVRIGRQASVAVRLWNPQQSLVNTQQPVPSLNIVVKVEGSFYDTVRFINDVLQLPWVQTVNPIMLARTQNHESDPIVMTDFTIKGFVSKEIRKTDELLKT